MLREVLKKQLERVKLSKEDYDTLTEITDNFVSKLEDKIKKKKIKAKVFVGGSLAKKTIIKKERYDIDVYVRFKFNKDILKLKSLLNKAKKIHGSRDYFQVKHDEEVYFEIIPVLDINKPEEAENVTDLSYFHVKYVLNHIKRNKKLAEEIILGKSFAYASDCYGAESYIQGFSGYSIELLTCYYKSFVKFLKEIVKERGKDKKIILDPAKHYKTKQALLMNLNEAKHSEIIFIDPTFKERNVLAALSKETLDRFKEYSKNFLKKPSLEYFKKKKVDEEKYKIKLEIKTDKQEGDIAGTKLKKFYKLLIKRIEIYFKIKNTEFEYQEGKKARLYFNLDKRKEIIIHGPPIIKVENVAKFKKKHKNLFLKNHFVFAREKPTSFEKFLSEFKKKNKKRMKEMDILELKKI